MKPLLTPTRISDLLFRTLEASNTNFILAIAIFWRDFDAGKSWNTYLSSCQISGLKDWTQGSKNVRWPASPNSGEKIQFGGIVVHLDWLAFVYSLNSECVGIVLPLSITAYQVCVTLETCRCFMGLIIRCQIWMPVLWTIYTLSFQP